MLGLGMGVKHQAPIKPTRETEMTYDEFQPVKSTNQLNQTSVFWWDVRQILMALVVLLALSENVLIFSEARSWGLKNNV